MRRMSMFAWVVVGTVFISSCGGGSGGHPSGSTSASQVAAAPRLTGTDSQQIAELIKAYGANPPLLCTTFASARMVMVQFGGRTSCLAGANQPGARDPGVKVDKVKVTGNTATAVRTSEANPGKGTKALLALVKEHGAWKVQQIVPTR